MNWASARSSRAPRPQRTVKRDLASRAPRSKSRIPRISPSSQWGRGAKSTARGAPQRRTSTFSSAVAPTGTEACGRFGNRSASSPSAASTVRSSASSVRISSPTRRDSSIAGGGVLPAALGLRDRLGRAVPAGLQLVAGLEERAAAPVQRPVLVQRDAGAPRPEPRLRPPRGAPAGRADQAPRPARPPRAPG